MSLSGVAGPLLVEQSGVYAAVAGRKAAWASAETSVPAPVKRGSLRARNLRLGVAGEANLEHGPRSVHAGAAAFGPPPGSVPEPTPPPPWVFQVTA